jgi:hypothetical protein
MSIEFALAFRRTPFGRLSDPQIPVTGRCPGSYLDLRFLIDTGAEFAPAPRELAARAGLVWDALPAIRMVGVEQGSVPVRLGRLPIRIGESELVVRCRFAANSRTPFLLGRADFLDRFVLTIDLPRQRIILMDVAGSAA